MSLIETDSLSNQDLLSRLEIASLTAGEVMGFISPQD